MTLTLNSLTPEALAYRANSVKEYAANGFALTPCRADKSPKNERWQMTLPEPGVTIESLGNPPMWGVPLQDDDLVLDVDPRRYAKDETGQIINQLSLLWGQLVLPGLAELGTFVVETGGKGYHIYFKKPPGFKTRTVAPGYPAIEIKSKGYFVCGAGSINKDGKIYKSARGSLAYIAQAPQALLDFVHQPFSVVKADIDDENLDDPNSIWQFTKSLQNGEPTGTYRRACIGFDFGLTEETVFQLMMDHYNVRRGNPKSETKLRDTVSNAAKYLKNSIGSSHPSVHFESVDTSKWEDDESTNDDGAIQADKPKKLKTSKTIINIVNHFFVKEIKEGEPNPLYQLVRLNLRSGRIEFNRGKQAYWNKRPTKHWRDRDDLELMVHFSHKHKIELTATDCVQAVSVAAQRLEFDPLEEWLTKLISWDGKPRVDRLFIDYAGVENDEQGYALEVGRIFCIGATARALDPGCQYDTTVVLQGPQGIGKSQFVRILGGEFYLDAHIDLKRRADTVQQMRGKWICEISEMTSSKMEDQEALKAYMTAQEDVVRFAYGRHNESYERSTAFIGTTNQEQYLKDRTGNRRYLSLVCTKFDLVALKRDRDQIFAEAYHRWKQGEEYYMQSEEMKKIAAEIQASKLEEDPWLQPIYKWLENGGDELLGLPVLTSANIADALGYSLSRQTPQTAKRIATIMRDLGYRQSKIREDGKRLVVWVRVE